MKVLVADCYLCGARLQWPDTGLVLDGLRRHFQYVHPTVRFDPSQYDAVAL